MAPISKLRSPENIASLRDCIDTLAYLGEAQAGQDAEQAGKKLDIVSRVTRQFEKALLVATVASTALSLNLFIGSVSLVGSSGAFFLVPLALSVGSTLIAVDLVTAKMLAERIRKIARGLQELPAALQTEARPALLEKSLKGIKKIQYGFNDLLVLPDISSMEFFSVKQSISFFVLKHVSKLVLAHDAPVAADEDGSVLKVADAP